MKFKEQRDVLSHRASLFRENLCAPPGLNHLIKFMDPNERMSLCTLKKGSMTIEAALVMPFFLSVLLTFFSLFGQYALAAELCMEAAADAKKIAVVLGCIEGEEREDVTIYKSGETKIPAGFSFFTEKKITMGAVCRSWVGFTGLEQTETYVYVTPNGSVYHLYSDCSHLKLSVRKVLKETAKQSKNQNGSQYRPCDFCGYFQAVFVYITEEGECYHSERDCSSLKRTVRQVPLSEVEALGCCMRCMGRKE